MRSPSPISPPKQVTGVPGRLDLGSLPCRSEASYTRSHTQHHTWEQGGKCNRKPRLHFHRARGLPEEHSVPSPFFLVLPACPLAVTTVPPKTQGEDTTAVKAPKQWSCTDDPGYSVSPSRTHGAEVTFDPGSRQCQRSVPLTSSRIWSPLGTPPVGGGGS